MGFSFDDFASNKHIKHVFHKLSPVTDAFIMKGASKVQSLRTGGRVSGKRGARVPAILHGQEYVLPASVKPTKAQRSAVAKLKAKERKH